MWMCNAKMFWCWIHAIFVTDLIHNTVFGVNVIQICEQIGGVDIYTPYPQAQNTFLMRIYIEAEIFFYTNLMRTNRIGRRTPYNVGLRPSNVLASMHQVELLLQGQDPEKYPTPLRTNASQKWKKKSDNTKMFLIFSFWMTCLC